MIRRIVPQVWGGGSASSDQRKFSAEFTIRYEDQRAVRLLRTTELTFWPFTGCLGIVIALVALALAYDQWEKGNPTGILIIIGGSVAGLALVAKPFFSLWRGFVRGFWKGFYLKRGLIDRPVLVTLDITGIELVWGTQTTSTKWEGILCVEEDEERYFFFFEEFYAYIVAKRCFSDATNAEIQSALKDWLNAPKNVETPARSGF